MTNQKSNIISKPNYLEIGKEYDNLMEHLGVVEDERNALLNEKEELERRITDLDSQLDNVQCENSTFRDENVELDDLREENAMLAEENKNMAKHLMGGSGLSSDEVDNICKGFDDWEDVDPNEPTPSQMNEELRSGGW